MAFFGDSSESPFTKTNAREGCRSDRRDCMDLLHGDVFSLQNLLSLAVGSLCGIVGGAMPGLSTAGTLAILLPFTLNMAPLPAIALLVAAYTGAQYGGSITATLFNTPGAPESAVMTIDGFALLFSWNGAQRPAGRSLVRSDRRSDWRCISGVFSALAGT